MIRAIQNWLGKPPKHSPRVEIHLENMGTEGSYVKVDGHVIRARGFELRVHCGEVAQLVLLLSPRDLEIFLDDAMVIRRADAD